MTPNEVTQVAPSYFICGPEDFHPSECGGKGKCRHCDRRDHDVANCAFCIDDEWTSDFRLGEWVKEGDDWHFDTHGGLGHRLRQGEEMYCGVSIPHEHWGGGQAAIPPCPVCWPEETSDAD